MAKNQGRFVASVSIPALASIMVIIATNKHHEHGVSLWCFSPWCLPAAGVECPAPQGAGARAAPVLIGQEDEYYRKMAGWLNGLLLPGGATLLTGPLAESKGYGHAGLALYNEALALHQSGDYFPVLGICLGMELLAMAAATGGRELLERVRSKCSNFNRVLPLQLQQDDVLRKSRMFSNATAEMKGFFANEGVTFNYHGLCITPDSFNSYDALASNWRVLSENKDRNEKTYISVFEANDVPLYGVQFHPEKNIYEWKRNLPDDQDDIPHSPSAIAASRFFADFLVSEARKNSHVFPDENAERDHLIYQHQPIATGRIMKWEQLYLFS